jgi:tripartite-type tricarboxylate transporter receptor subunit TctC
LLAPEMHLLSPSDDGPVDLCLRIPGMKKILVMLAAVAAVAISSAARAEYPDRIVRIVVPFTAGGAVDLVARVMARYLSEQFHQEVYVDNRPGASGNLGAQQVEQAPADGTTLLFSASTFVVNPVVAAEPPPFDPLKDFTPLGLIAKGPLLFIAHAGVADGVQDFVAKAKAHPEAFNFATGGYGSAGHMAAESFKLRAGLSVPVVLYKGTGPAFTDLMGGTISGMLDPLVTSLPLAQGKQASALAIAASARSALAPDVPTFSEAGYPGFEFYTWYGLWGPANLPPNVVATISRALAAIGASGDTQKWFSGQGLEYSGIGGQSFVDFSKKEQSLYADIMKRGNITRQ